MSLEKQLIAITPKKHQANVFEIWSVLAISNGSVKQGELVLYI